VNLCKLKVKLAYFTQIIDITAYQKAGWLPP